MRIMFLFLSLVFLACTGPRGPVGPEGDPGVVDTVGTACHFYQNEGVLPEHNSNNWWFLALWTPEFDSCVIRVEVRAQLGEFWGEPRWERYMESCGIRIYENAECGAGWFYRVSVVYWGKNKP